MKEVLEGNWNQIKGKVKEQWGKLADDDLAMINGKRISLSVSYKKNMVMIKLVPQMKWKNFLGNSNSFLSKGEFYD